MLNNYFYHSSLGLLTPATVHYGQAELVRSQRQQILHRAYTAHPQRFVRGQPQLAALPTEVWYTRPDAGHRWIKKSYPSTLNSCSKLSQHA